jgi:maleylacetate reductase
LSQRPFFFRDGERVMRFGVGVVGQSAGLLRDHGFDGEWVLLTTERARGSIPEDVVADAADEFDVAHGQVPDVAAELMGGVAGRDVVAFGGGRVVDVGKAVVAAGGGKVAAIPTTLAGSTFTPFHRMPKGYDGYGSARPALVICEPALMTSAPPETLTATAMNALAHGIEALYGPLANPVTDAASLLGAPLIVTALEGDPLDREDLALGALLGGYSVGIAAGMVVHHACCQTIVRVLETPHAQTNSVMLPRSIAFMADRAPEPLGKLADALGEPDVKAVSERVARVAAGAGPTTLGDLGVTHSDLDRVLDALLDHPGVAATPGGADRETLHGLLESAEPG